MGDALPTVIVKHPEKEGETMRINKADFDPAKHEEAGAEKPKRTRKKAAPKAAKADK